MEFLFILLVLAILFVQYVVAKKFEEIALMKGYDESIHSLDMCFWLGVVGYLYVIALPQKQEKSKNPEAEKPTEKDSQPATAKSDLYECDSFIITAKQSAGHCFACGEHHSALRCCKIRTGVDVRETFICEKCSSLFIEREHG